MRLYLVQHGEAKSEDEDAERPLTDRGARHTRQLAERLAAAGSVTVERVLHSGKTRARQTAEAWAEALDVQVEETDGLAPLDDPSIWATRLSGDMADVMLVGHLPHLPKLAGLLLGGDAERSVVAFRQGGVVALERNAAVWSVWLAVPPGVI